MAATEIKENPGQFVERPRRGAVVRLAYSRRDAEAPGEDFIRQIEVLERRYLAANGAVLTASEREFSNLFSTTPATKDCR